ncbi:MAG: hypothetical protein KatS3mg054_1492 [Chloroflexus sp.]|nr:MAG: hypothetical protein KatS3mg023_3964 [Armatimonadota bacterium]GIV87463.1 MAG: hypothetical protein KatS3mg054_1492 [Chloroflexus sp.]
MYTAYLAAVTLHILAAMLWVGGMLFLVLVVLPAVRHPELQPHRQRIIAQTGIFFRRAGWIALGVLIVTGTFNVLYRWTSWDAVVDGSFWQTPAGALLGWKLVLFLAMLAVHAVHDFWLGPRAMDAMLQSGIQRALRLRRAASWVGRVVLLLSIVIVVLAVLFVRGC